MSFERSRCFGSCPEYSLSLTGDGSGVFTGGRFVVTEGAVRFAFDPHALEPMLDVLEDVDFFALNHRCGCWDPSGDSSNASLVVTIGRRSASFLSQMPCPFTHDSASHAALHERIEQAVAVLERVAGVARLVGTPEEALERRARESVARAPTGWKRDLSVLDGDGCLFPEKVEVPRLTFHGPSDGSAQLEKGVVIESLSLVSEGHRRDFEHRLPSTSVQFYRVQRSAPCRIDLLEARTNYLIARLSLPAASVDRHVAVTSSRPKANADGWWFALYEYDGKGLLNRLGCGAFELHASAEAGRPAPGVGPGVSRWTLDEERVCVVIGCWSANGSGSEVFAESLYATGKMPNRVTGGEAPRPYVVSKPLEQWSEPVVLLVASRP